MISNATGERSFSKLKLIKTYLRNSLAQDKLPNLALLYIENNILKSLNTKEITNIFVNMKTRKKIQIKKQYINKLNVLIILYIIIIYYHYL